MNKQLDHIMKQQYSQTIHIFESLVIALDHIMKQQYSQTRTIYHSKTAFVRPYYETTILSNERN